jgi:hypothetical protein
MSDELLEKVSKWLAKTGYPLEMRIARAARRARPLWVDQSRNYYDGETGKVRETDVVAAWGDPEGDYPVVVLVIECKAKPHPWVIFDDGTGLSDDGNRRLWSAVRRGFQNPYGDSASVALQPNAFTGGTLLKPDIEGLAAVEVKFNDSADDRNSAWDAARAATAAAHGVVSEFSEAQLARRHSGIVAFPIVVTSGKLFRSYLDGDEMKVEEADRLSVRVRLGANMDETRCLIVTEDALDSVLEEASKTPDILTMQFD